MSGRICSNATYGIHITLKCVNHPEKKWSTKNIGYVGARSVFYKHINIGPECQCPIESLVHDHEDDVK